MLGAFLRRRTRRQVSRWAGEVARRSRDVVWSRVHHRIGPMGLAEARGYIRARAAGVVHDEADAILSQHESQNPWVRDLLVSEATELVISFVLADLLKLGQQHFMRQRRAA